MKNSFIDFIKCMEGGCSTVSWLTDSGMHLFGRNFDFNRLADGTAVVYVPSGISYYSCGTEFEENLVEASRSSARYAVVGTGMISVDTNPIVYEGINECGLMGGQLYYRDFAYYNAPGTDEGHYVQPPMLVYHILAQCRNVSEAVEMINNKISIVDVPMFGLVPKLHWSFSDRSGETIVVEPDKGGIRIYRKTIGVMTNSPSFNWHMINLLNYAGIRSEDYESVDIDGNVMDLCFSGSGAKGLPGDFSSPSRFIRLSFLKKYGVRGATEEDGVVNLLHALGNAAFPMGIVKIAEINDASSLDKEVLPYDFTVYSSVMCSETLRFYWITYENSRVRCIDMNKLLKEKRKMQFDISREHDFNYLL